MCRTWEEVREVSNEVDSRAASSRVADKATGMQKPVNGKLEIDEKRG